MISLLSLKRKLQQNKLITLQALIKLFNCTPKDIEPQLTTLLQKGYIKVIETPEGCGSKCTQCKPNNNVIYQWQGGKA